MKRLISMMLAVMLIATLGVLPVCAAEHTDHFIKFLDSDGEESFTITLPPATVGREYSYTIGVSSCSDHVTFRLNSELPDGLHLNEATGEISGIPTTPATEEESIIIAAENDCDDFPGTEANFYLTVQPAPATITWRIPYTKRVVLGGSRNPGSQTFTLEIFDVGVPHAADQVVIFGDTGSIATNGSGDYQNYVSVTAPADALDEGVKVREKPGSAAHWTYSYAVYTIWPVRDDGSGEIVDFKIYEGDYSGIDDEGTECERMTFTNTYTYSPSHDDDDDDYDPPVREPEKDKEPQPQKDEPKTNPSTGRGTTWDYLAYLFHKYFSWAV